MTLLVQVYYGCFDIYVFGPDRWMIPMKVNQLHPDCGIKYCARGFPSCLVDKGGCEILKFDLMLCVSSEKRIHFVSESTPVIDVCPQCQHRDLLYADLLALQRSLSGFLWSGGDIFFFPLKEWLSSKMIINSHEELVRDNFSTCLPMKAPGKHSNSLARTS